MCSVRYFPSSDVTESYEFMWNPLELSVSIVSFKATLRNIPRHYVAMSQQLNGFKTASNTEHPPNAGPRCPRSEPLMQV